MFCNKSNTIVRHQKSLTCFSLLQLPPITLQLLYVKRDTKREDHKTSGRNTAPIEADSSYFTSVFKYNIYYT